jgi:hypothetical protein
MGADATSRRRPMAAAARQQRHRQAVTSRNADTVSSSSSPCIRNDLDAAAACSTSVAFCCVTESIIEIA